MAISPWQLGAMGPPWQVTFQTPPIVFGGVPQPFNLTGATAITTLIRDNRRSEGDPLYQRTGTGTWSVTNAAAGQATYFPSAADVGTEGDFSVVFSLVGIDGLPYKWPPQRFIVTQRSN